MSRFAYKEEFDEILVSYLIKQHTDDLKSILLAKDVEKHYAVVIEAALLFDVCIELRGLLLNNPVKVLPRFDAMLRKAANLVFDEQSMEEMSLKDHLHARITGLVFYPELNRSVIPKSGDVGLFVSISGTIVRASLVQLLQSEKRYTCNSCKHVFSVKNDHEQFSKIRGHLRCPNPDSCPSTKFSQTIDADQWRDYQEVKIQERVQALSIRVIPRTISVVLEDDLVDSCKPGDDVTVVGVMCRRWRSCSEGTRCHVQHVIIANHIQVNNQRSHSRITTNMQKHFTDFWSEYKERPLQGRNEIIQSLCPQIYGLFQIKLAVALILAGGVAKSDESGTRIRGESHMLLIGDPGTGKSQFLKYAAKITPRSVFTTGVGSTSAGLTVSAVKDSGQWNLEAGALVLADGGLCCIDEFNSIKENDKSSILEAMEQQTISVAKAGLVCKMNARCTILAATNPKGHYDQNMVASINVAIPSPLLSRFDLIYVMLDTKSDDWDRLVSNYVLHGIQPLVNSSYKMSMSKMQSYFSLVKQLKPSLSADANSILQKYYLAHRKSDDRNVTRTTVRLLESMVRLSEAHAKLMFRSEVLIMDAIVAIIVMESSLGCLGLLGPENILHTNFPQNPDQLYEAQGEIILKKFGLEDIWKKEQQRLHSVNGNGFGTPNSLASVTDATSDGRDEGYISTTLEPNEEKLVTVNNRQNEPPELSLSSECTKTPNLTKDVEAPKSLVSLRTIKKLEKFAFVSENDDRSSPAKTTSDAERNIFGNGELITSTPKYTEMPKLAHNSQENLKQEERFLPDSGIGHQNSKTIVPNTIRPSNSAEIEVLCEINESDLTLDWL